MESYVTRQQVRAINRKLFAYEMIYSDSSTNVLQELISHIIQSYNPEDSMANVPTIIELKDNDLTTDTLDKIYLLAKDSVIIQVNNSIFANPDKANIVKTLKNQKYTILVEINKDDKIVTLTKVFADIIKFDITNIPDIISNGKEVFECKKLAYNVNTAEDFVLAESTNIDYYAGSYISPTKEIEIQDTKHSKVMFIEIIAEINKEDSDIDDIANIIKRDSLMSAQIIRLSNSAYFASRTRIDSVEKAIIRIGINNLKRWIFLLQFSRNNNVPEELLQTSYHRAIFCERIVKEHKNNEISSNDAYLIGLFSTLDVLTGKPMDKEISSMNLSESIEDALIYREGTGGMLINLVKAYEEADWERVEKYLKKFRLNKDTIYKIYFQSLDEVTKLWRSLTELGGIY